MGRPHRSQCLLRVRGWRGARGRTVAAKLVRKVNAHHVGGGHGTGLFGQDGFGQCLLGGQEIHEVPGEQGMDVAVVLDFGEDRAEGLDIEGDAELAFIVVELPSVNFLLKVAVCQRLGGVVLHGEPLQMVTDGVCRPRLLEHRDGKVQGNLLSTRILHTIANFSHNYITSFGHLA